MMKKNLMKRSLAAVLSAVLVLQNGMSTYNKI